LAQWAAKPWASGTVGTVLTVILYLSFLVVGALTVPALLLAPRQDPMSEATEEYLLGTPPSPFSLGRFIHASRVSLVHSLSRLTLALVGLLVLLPLNFVFGLGSLAYAICSALWASALLTIEYLSGPMARHLLPFRNVFKVLRAYFWACLGFGLLIYVILWVPIVNFFLVPIAVVGGTLLFHSLKLKSVA
jgi:CysZ protein